jgi:DNA-directed RNA polymerase subunit RPC12/RpoP
LSQPVRKYPCRKCGHPFEAYPPDDLHTQAVLRPCDADEDCIQQEYECDTCGEVKMNKLYWRNPNFFIIARSG